MTFSHLVWAEQVAEGADLPDQRLQSRLTAILVDTIERPDAAIPQAAGDDGQAKATYRFYANERTPQGRCITASPWRRPGGASTEISC